MVVMHKMYYFKHHGSMEGVYINGAQQGITFHETDIKTKKVLQEEINSNKGYKGMSRNCSTFARVGVRNATEKDVDGTENYLFYNYVTPNSLFEETKALLNTKVIVDPGNKTDYKFSIT